MSGSKVNSLTQEDTLSSTKKVTKEGEPRASYKCCLPSTVIEIPEPKISPQQHHKMTLQQLHMSLKGSENIQNLAVSIVVLSTELELHIGVDVTTSLEGKFSGVHKGCSIICTPSQPAGKTVKTQMPLLTTNTVSTATRAIATITQRIKAGCPVLWEPNAIMCEKWFMR